MVLPHDSVSRILTAMTDPQVLALEKEYHANVADGTQWIFWVTQGAAAKSVYLDNHFPAPIIRFADSLDDVLAKNRVFSVKWLPALDAEAAQFQKQFWDSIKK